MLVEGLAARATSAIEKTRLYDEVVRSQRLFEGIAEASPDVLYLFDVRRGRNVFVSRSVEKVVGRTPREIGGLGEKRTLRAVARWAQHWNHAGAPSAEKNGVEFAGEHFDCPGRKRDAFAQKFIGAPIKLDKFN